MSEELIVMSMILILLVVSAGSRLARSLQCLAVEGACFLKGGFVSVDIVSSPSARLPEILCRDIAEMDDR